jgi:hypothetical protein
MKTVVTKAKYAELKSRKPSAISNWIADGKISKAALVGEGVRARIWVEQADADLQRSLDPSQQGAQAVPVAPTPTSVQTPEPGDGIRPKPVTTTTEDEDLRRRRKADADKAEHDAETARRRNAVDEGRWIEAADAAKEWARELAQRLADFEDFLCNKLARDNGDRFGVAWKAEAVRYRQMFRQHRMGAAELAKSEADGLAAAPQPPADAT